MLEATADTRYVWSPVYIDAMVARDRNADANSATGTGGMEERVYALQDANWNTTGIVAASGVPGITAGTVINRFAYTPYGESQTLTSSWATPATGSAPLTPWSHLFQGLKLNDVTGLTYVRHRDYSPTLGRFIERDPIGFEAGDNNWYRFVANGPTVKTDPSGLSRLGVQLRDMYLKRAGLGALVIPQLFTSFYEWLVDYEWSFQDDGTIENAQNSSRARHAFMIKLALDRNIPADNAWHAVTVGTQNIFSTISRQQYDIIIRQEPGTPVLDNAPFWLGGLHEFRGKGSYEISMCKKDGVVTAQFRNMHLVWGWVDHVDANSAIEYNWLVDSFGQGFIETTIGDMIGDKLLNGNYKAIIGFWERGDAGKYRYDLQSGEISASF